MGYAVRFIPFLLGALIGVGVLLALVHQRREEREASLVSPEEVAKQRFLHLRARAPVAGRREAGAATRAIALELSDSEIESILEGAVNPPALVAEGQAVWRDTALRLADLAWLREARLDCAAQHALPLEGPCFAEFEMIVDVRGVHPAGTIVYSRASASPAKPGDADACRAYISCLASIRLGASLPVPSGWQDEVVALEQKTAFSWASPSLFDPERVRDLISLEASDRRASRRHGLTPYQEYQLSLNEQLGEYLRQHLDVVKEAFHDGAPSSP